MSPCGLHFPVANKSFLVMVYVLILDVVGYLVDIVAANCKCTITTLPFKKAVGFDFMGYEVGGTTFCFAY